MKIKFELNGEREMEVFLQGCQIGRLERESEIEKIIEEFTNYVNDMGWTEKIKRELCNKISQTSEKAKEQNKDE